MENLRAYTTLINRHDLKISRPGLWFPTIWIYLVPFSFQEAFWKEPVFWLGFVFVTFPLNYLVYGLNDFNDYQADAMNERKGNFLFGAKSSKLQLEPLIKKITMVISPFIIAFTLLSGYKMFLLLLFMVVINVLYNFKPFRIKERPPFEIIIQVGYVVTGVFSVLLNGEPMLPWQTLVYLSLFAFQAHIAGEIMDIEPDQNAGKRTTAVLLGRKKSKLLMLFLLILETYILAFWFKDYALAGFLGVFSLWLLVDIFIIFKNQPYTLYQMTLFGIAMNVSALLSMLWILYSGKLLHPVM